MAEEKKRKLLGLEEFRRRLPHVSQRGLANTLQEIKRTGMPELDSCKDMRTARDIKLTDPTPYGPIRIEKEVPKYGGGKAYLRIASPLALLWFLYFSCESFSKFIDERIEVCPSTPEQPWNLLLYCDEVHPGDALGGKHLRKFHAIYFSFKEFGLAALAHEDMWFTIATLRSQVVNEVPGGLSKVFGILLQELFVDGPLSDIGLLLQSADRTHRLFSKLGLFIQDGAAHKGTWHCKGDSGCKLCVLCRNIFSLASEVAAEDGEVMLRCNAKTYAELDLASGADLRYAVRRINELRLDPLVLDDDFENLEKALGFTWSPYNLLGDESMDPYLDVPNQFIHDWMHMIFVGGVFNLTLHFFLEAIKTDTRSNVYASLKGYVSRWFWPTRFKQARIDELFSNSKRSGNVKASSFRCSASEGLSLYAAIAHWALAVLPADTCPAEREAYTALCDVIDCLRAAAFTVVVGSTMLETIERFLALYDTAFGLEWSTPKFHWLLHFGDYADMFEGLITCWPLERKHKVPKEYGADVRNTRIYERSVLHEVLGKHIAVLSREETFSFLRAGLFKPQKANQKVLNWLSVVLKIPSHLIECKMARNARQSTQIVCSIGDVVLYKTLEGDLEAGEVWNNLELEGELGVILQRWTFVSEAHGAAIWNLTEDLNVVLSDQICDVLVWTKHSGEQAKTLLPAHSQ